MMPMLEASEQSVRSHMARLGLEVRNPRKITWTVAQDDLL